MQSLQPVATTSRNTNVLQHLVGFLKGHLDHTSRHELLTHIHDYRTGLVPLIVPLTLLRHYIRLFNVSYLKDQVFLNPHPKELALEVHV
jgi:uncharacterized protein YbgA (DUF1722 family)